MTLYANIERRCAAAKISISALERTVGLGNATIKGWQTSAPKITSIKKVADYFGCTIDELLNNTEVQ